MQKSKNDSLAEITQEKYLDNRLLAYSNSDYYPFHMPGHKRQMKSAFDPYQIDITEIDGFDNLHASEEILKDAQNRAAALYGARRSFFLVNGSTCGILATISASVKKGGKLLIARNCHKAVYHAAYLRGLSLHYVLPVINEYGIQGEIRPEDVKQALVQDKDIEAVVITSPTYDGVVSNISEIAEIVHEYGIPLIVDEAHGAHFGFHPYFPQTAVRLGADMVIQSMHKTLPSLTQTALVHVCSSLVDEEKVQKFLGIYETSSPSYVLMAGMERCIRLLSEEGKERFDAYADSLKQFRENAQKLQKIRVLDVVSDPSKILITGIALGLDGKKLYEILLQDYHLQMEMCGGSYVLAMTSFMDSEESYERLFMALLDIENRFLNQSGCENGEEKLLDFVKRVYRRNPIHLKLHEAWDMESEEIPLLNAANRVAAGFVNLYPPGIPLLVPGEIITEELIDGILECDRLHLSVQGVSGNLRIKVVI